MNDKLLMGMMLGFVAGAIVMRTCPKAQEVLEKGKEQVVDAINKI